jgi:hypothetical protein
MATDKDPPQAVVRGVREILGGDHVPRGLLAIGWPPEQARSLSSES